MVRPGLGLGALRQFDAGIDEAAAYDTFGWTDSARRSDKNVLEIKGVEASARDQMRIFFEC